MGLARCKSQSCCHPDLCSSRPLLLIWTLVWTGLVHPGSLAAKPPPVSDPGLQQQQELPLRLWMGSPRLQPPRERGQRRQRASAPQKCVTDLTFAIPGERVVGKGPRPGPDSAFLLSDLVSVIVGVLVFILVVVVVLVIVFCCYKWKEKLTVLKQAIAQSKKPQFR